MYSEHFSINNIPFGVASTSSHPTRSVVTRFEDNVIFLETLASAGTLSSISESTLKTFSEVSTQLLSATWLYIDIQKPTVNAYAALPKSEHQAVRSAIQDLLRNGTSNLPAQSSIPISDVTLHLPIKIGAFSDYSCSREHMLNCAEAIFGKREAPPGFEYFPPGYHGRASSIVVSGTSIVRPKGQFRNAEKKVVYGPTEKLDYELEIGAVIGKGNKLGERIKIENVDDHLFGIVILNDWSGKVIPRYMNFSETDKIARDIQNLEMNPLGPLNSKSFSTTISPWIITLDALEPFRAPRPQRESDIPLAPYFQDPHPLPTYAFNLTSSVKRKGSSKFVTMCDTQFSSICWTLRDLVAHQTVNGCNLDTGDILATGTISGNAPGSNACQLETASKGGIKITTDDGGSEQLVYFNDGDTISITGFMGPGVGFGDCVGTILPANE